MMVATYAVLAAAIIPFGTIILFLNFVSRRLDDLEATVQRQNSRLNDFAEKADRVASADQSIETTMRNRDAAPGCTSPDIGAT